jgi:hypothetical protein
MHLKLMRTGGFAGISPPPKEVDTTSLSKKEAQRLESLVADAKFFELPKTIQSAGPQPDRFQYSLQVTHDDGRQHAISWDEAAAPESLRELLHAVQSLK